MPDNTAKLVFTGDDSGLQKTFDRVGSGAKDMADDVSKQSKRMADDSDASSRSIGGAIDSSEGKFRGFGDIVGGTGDIMQGFKDGNLAGVAMGFADLAGGMTALVIPALTSLKTFLMTGLTPALTMISAHPLIAGILIGGAIIAGLFLLERKFGLVSDAVRGLGGIFEAIWPGIKAVINGILAGLEFIGNAAIKTLMGPLTIANMIPGVKSIVPNVPQIKLPRLHTGGIAGRDMLAVLQQGEQVIPRGQPGPGNGLTINVSGVGMGKDFAYAVAQALRDNKMIGVTV